MADYAAGAEERHNKGYNCAQAVACAFAERVGADEELLFKAFQGHGLGMGGMEATCGALTGAVAVAGLAMSDGTPASKRACYAASKRLVERFGEEAGAIQCRAIKGIDTGKVLTPCADCIAIAARLAEEAITRD